jgi:hypothetical protein
MSDKLPKPELWKDYSTEDKALFYLAHLCQDKHLDAMGLPAPQVQEEAEQWLDSVTIDFEAEDRAETGEVTRDMFDDPDSLKPKEAPGWDKDYQ